MKIQKFADGTFDLETPLRARFPLDAEGKPREPLHELLEVRFELEAAAKIAATLDPGIHDVPDMASHYLALNGFPATPGTKWPVTEQIYNHFLEVLPPLNWKGSSFMMSEAHHHTDKGVVRSRYFKENGLYWHEYVEVPFK